MTELDVVQWTRLRRRFENVLKGEPEATSIWCYKAEAEAIIAALENRDGLRAALQSISSFPPSLDGNPVIREMRDIASAALEGRDG